MLGKHHSSSAVPGSIADSKIQQQNAIMFNNKVHTDTLQVMGECNIESLNCEFNWCKECNSMTELRVQLVQRVQQEDWQKFSAVVQMGTQG